MSQEVFYVVPSEKVQPKKYCCLLLNEFSKGINLINQEFKRLQMLENEYNKKLVIYLDISRRVDKKLCNLWDISSRNATNDYDRAMEIYTFTNRVIKSWQDGNAAIAKEIQNVLLVSCTNPNAPLKVIVEKIFATSSTSRYTYQKISPHIFCMRRFNIIYNQALPLFGRLRNGNLILQYFLSVSKGIPHLSNLEKTVDQYISSLPISLQSQVYQPSATASTAQQQLVPQSSAESDELSAYSRVVQLLNGELLAEDYPLHHHAKILPLVSNEYILPDMMSEVVNKPEMGGDVRNIMSQIQNETTKEPRGVTRNELAPNGTATVTSASQKVVPTAPRSVGVMLLERPTGTSYPNLTGSSLLPSSATNVKRMKLPVQVIKRQVINRRQAKVETELLDLKPIKMPKLEMDLLTPLA